MGIKYRKPFFSKKGMEMWQIVLLVLMMIFILFLIFFAGDLNTKIGNLLGGIGDMY